MVWTSVLGSTRNRVGHASKLFACHNISSNTVHVFFSHKTYLELHPRAPSFSRRVHIPKTSFKLRSLSLFQCAKMFQTSFNASRSMYMSFNFCLSNVPCSVIYHSMN